MVPLIPELKISIIYENHCDNRNLQEGWGFSALIECENRKILFDTGGDPKAFFSNIEKLNIRLNEVTDIAFSHRHWDHRAGFENILIQLREGTRVFLPKYFLSTLLKKTPAKLQKKVISSFAEIGKHIYSLVLKGNEFLLYEQALLFNTSKGLVVITGCAHPGIINILQTAKQRVPGPLYFVLGGFHLLDATAHRSAEIVKKCRALEVQKIAPCHCTGDHTIRQFAEAYGDSFINIGTGSVFTI